VGLEDPFTTRPEYVAAYRGWVTASSWMLDHLRRTDEDLDEYDEASDELKAILSLAPDEEVEA
jgi:hypothetical protein